jgi:hypothetical protein
VSTTTRTRRNVASICHALAERFELSPEQVAAIAADHGVKKVADADKRLAGLVEAWIAAKVAADQPETAPKPKRERQASLTLSQRRALLRLLDAEDGVAPTTGFKALPYEHLVEVGYAVKTDATYTLTDAGRERAEATNPGYRVWSSGETVVEAEAAKGTRPPAGTARGIFETEPVVATAE